MNYPSIRTKSAPTAKGIKTRVTVEPEPGTEYTLVIYQYPDQPDRVYVEQNGREVYTKNGYVYEKENA